MSLRLPLEGISACMTSQFDVFVWLGNRYNVCQFPDVRYFVVVDCRVVDVREVL